MKQEIDIICKSVVKDVRDWLRNYANRYGLIIKNVDVSIYDSFGIRNGQGIGVVLSIPKEIIEPDTGSIKQSEDFLINYFREECEKRKINLRNLQWEVINEIYTPDNHTELLLLGSKATDVFISWASSNIIINQFLND